MRPKTERNEDIWQRHVRGESMQSIAESYGISDSTVSEIITRRRARMGPIDAAALRVEWLRQLEQLQGMAQEIIDAEPAPMYRGSEPVMRTDPETGVERHVDDHGGRLAAGALFLKAQESARKMVGADAAAKIESTSTVRYTVEGVDTEELR